jgi:hypothetical protein
MCEGCGVDETETMARRNDVRRALIHPPVVKLKSDMRTLDGDPIQDFKNPTNPEPPMGTVPHCMEAPYMFKRNGIYYLMYSDMFCQDSTYNVKYVPGKSPLGHRF